MVQVKKRILQIFVVLISIYIFLGLFLFFSQRAILYYPTNQDFDDCQGFLGYERLDHNGTRFYFKQGTNDNVVIHYHGNAGSTCDRSFVGKFFEQTNNSLIFVEYAGYSQDYRKPSEKLLLQDATNIKNFIEAQDFQEITLYGQSLGSGVASYHSSIQYVDSIVLVTTFTNLKDVAKSKYPIYPVSFLLKEKYTIDTWLQDFQGEILFIHGDNDRIIPSKFSKRLYGRLNNSKKQYVLIPEKGHNDLWFSQKFQETIIEFLKE